jgi:hypothetical protein
MTYIAPEKVSSVKKKAKEVNDISLQYQFAHATFACNRLLESDFNKYCEKRRSELREEAKSASEDALHSIQEKLEELEKPYHIYIDYLNIPEDGARVVRVPLSNRTQLVINLPLKILNEAVDPATKWYKNQKKKKKLRKQTAHELGHIILSTEKIFSSYGLYGTKGITGEEEELAKIFAKTLLELRKERNEKIRKDPNLSDVFY